MIKLIKRIVAKIKGWFKKEPVKSEPVKVTPKQAKPKKEKSLGSSPTKKYPNKRTWRKGCFGLSPAEKRYRAMMRERNGR